MSIRCRLFGHHYKRNTIGLTGVNYMPVFQCRTCETEWMPGLKGARTVLTRRDTFAPHREAANV